MSIKNSPIPNPQHELDLRLARMRQLQADLDAAIGDVDRHRQELERIRREVESLARTITSP